MHLDWLTKELLCWSFFYLLLVFVCRKVGLSCVFFCFSARDFLEQSILLSAGSYSFVIFLKTCVGRNLRLESIFSPEPPQKHTRMFRLVAMMRDARSVPSAVLPFTRMDAMGSFKCPPKRNWDCIRRCCLLALVGDTCFWGGGHWAQKRNSVFVDVRAGRSPALFAKI